MSGFAVRQFILQNIAAVGVHCPIPGVSAAALRVTYGAAYPSAEFNVTTAAKPGSADATAPPLSTSADRVAARLSSLLIGNDGKNSSTASSDDGTSKGHFTLMTPEEMEWLRQRRNEGAEEARVVLFTRPTRSLVRGFSGAVLNVCLGCLISPFILLITTLERVRVAANPAFGLVTGPLFGLAWAGAFLAAALYASMQQATRSVWLSLVATPVHYLRVGPPRVWSVLYCRFVTPRGRVGDADPLLTHFDSDQTLAERAMRRLNTGRRSRDGYSGSGSVGGSGKLGKAQYAGRKRSSSAPVDSEDYYGLLGVERDASEKAIKAAYNRLVMEIHPDKNPAPGAAAHFDNVTKAYRVLSNPSKRKKYDLGGTKGVDDLGAKKREGVRAIFGGDALARLTGDVFTGNFSQRVIDGLDYTALELAVKQARVHERCRDELLTAYLAHYHGNSSSSGTTITGNGKRSSKSAVANTDTSSSTVCWAPALAVQLRRVTSTGLSREVLYTIGAEYDRIQRNISASSPAERLLLLVREVGPHRAKRHLNRMRAIAAVRRDTFKDPAAMVNVAWHTGVMELELNARIVALTVLTDPTLDKTEKARRMDGMAALAETFMKNGCPYKGADKNSMDQLMSSLREYQQQKQRRGENQ